MIDEDKLRFYEQMLEGATHHFAWELIREIKRLRKQLSKAENWVRDYLTDINGNYQSYENRVLHDDFRQQMGDEEE